MLRLRRLLPELPRAATENDGSLPTEVSEESDDIETNSVNTAAVAAPDAAAPGLQPPVISHCADQKIRGLRAAASRQLQRAFGVATCCLLVLVMAFCLAGIADGLGWATGGWSAPADAPPKKPPKGGDTKRPPKRSRGTNEGSRKGGAGSEEEASERPEGPEAHCEPIPQQEGIPPRVVEQLQGLYSGEHQLGRAQTGCPLEIKEKSTPEGVLYWVVGKSHGDPNPKSVAVLPPRRFHKAIVLWPALTTVEQIIKRGENVGGPRRFPRYASGGGDYYVIDSEHGTVLMMREVTGTATEAEPYVSLPASASAALLSLTRESETWRWPVQQATHGDLERFQLKLTGRPVGRYFIRYDAKKKTAKRNAVVGKPDFYTPTQAVVPAAEVGQWAPPAPAEIREREEAENPDEP